MLDRGTREVVMEPVQLGIDIAGDGEVRRENYIHYHCRHPEGIDFISLTRKVLTKYFLPTSKFKPQLPSPPLFSGRQLFRNNL